MAVEQLTAPPDLAAAALAGAAVDHPDLVELARGWLRAAHVHRTGLGLFGKVGVAVLDTPAGVELHLSEETTFKTAPPGADGRADSRAAKKKAWCPLEAALAWIALQAVERKKHGATGKVHLESEQRAGLVSWVKVTETTVIARSRLDAGTGLR